MAAEDLQRRRFVKLWGASALALGGASAVGLAPGQASARTRRPTIPYAQTKVRNAEYMATMCDIGIPLLDYQWIVVHHTAAEYATLGGIDRYHRNHFGDELGAEYHFVIGNGKKSTLGLIEPARWRYQEWAAHLFHPERAPNACAVCLIGNFEKRELPDEMLDALVGLTRALMKKFNIPAERVATHRDIDGRLTQCPGKLFPKKAFFERIKAAPELTSEPA